MTLRVGVGKGWFMTIPVTTAREEIFARSFAAHRNVGEAYRAAYDCAGLSPKQIDGRGRSTLKSPAVVDRIRDLTNLAAGDDIETAAKVLRYFLDIAMADPNELVSIRIGCCRYCHGAGNSYQWRAREFAEALTEWERLSAFAGKGPPLPAPDCSGGLDFDHVLAPALDCPECSGEGVPRTVLHPTENLSVAGARLFGGVKLTPSGPQLIMADQMKAAEIVARMTGALVNGLNVTAAVTTMHRVIDLEAIDGDAAARAYQDMIAGNLTLVSQAANEG